MLMSTSALSRGWSLAGNHQGAMCGSFIATTSLSVGQPVALAARRRTGPGCPAYQTLTVNLLAGARSDRRGVIRSSCRSGCVNVGRRAVDASPA